MLGLPTYCGANVRRNTHLCLYFRCVTVASVPLTLTYPSLASLVRGEPAAGGDSRYRPDRCHSPGCRDRRLEDILIGAQSCRLDRVGAEAAHDWRQGQARQHHQAGQSILAMVAGRWRHGRHPLADRRHVTIGHWPVLTLCGLLLKCEWLSLRKL